MGNWRGDDPLLYAGIDDLTSASPHLEFPEIFTGWRAAKLGIFWVQADQFLAQQIFSAAVSNVNPRAFVIIRSPNESSLQQLSYENDVVGTKVPTAYGPDR